jgi:hypothetical protein
MEIDKCHKEICGLEKVMDKLIKQSALFEVGEQEFTILKKVRKELRLLKVSFFFFLPFIIVSVLKK